MGNRTQYKTGALLYQTDPMQRLPLVAHHKVNTLINPFKWERSSAKELRNRGIFTFVSVALSKVKGVLMRSKGNTDSRGRREIKTSRLLVKAMKKKGLKIKW